MEEKPEEVEDAESTSGESFIDGSEDEGPSTSGQDDEELHLEVSEFASHLSCKSLSFIVLFLFPSF